MSVEPLVAHVVDEVGEEALHRVVRQHGAFGVLRVEVRADAGVPLPGLAEVVEVSCHLA